jgi:hypothetical protein
MIKIVDYGMGNLRSVQKAFEFLGYEAGLSSSGDELLSADGLVLPGVGAFKKAMENLRRQGLVSPLCSFLSSGKPFLGICLGLQILFERILFLLRPFILRRPGGRGHSGGDIRLWIGIRGRHMAGQHIRSPVPSGEEPEARA